MLLWMRSRKAVDTQDRQAGCDKVSCREKMAKDSAGTEAWWWGSVVAGENSIKGPSP